MSHELANFFLCCFLRARSVMSSPLADLVWGAPSPFRVIRSRVLLFLWSGVIAEPQLLHWDLLPVFAIIGNCKEATGEWLGVSGH
jgi:hypothetical protein